MAKLNTLNPPSSLNKGINWRALYKLTKPKVVALIVLTAVVGACLATSGLPPWQALLIGNLGIGLMAAGAAAFNHYIDSEADAAMARTHKRPLPTGAIANWQALLWASLLSVVGFVMLYRWVNPLTAWLTAASLVGYAVIYTLWLKRATPQNIVIGGLAGAMPPLLGWTAVNNAISAEPLLLVMLIFTWTPPHFWALAIARREDYAKVNIPMLPVTHGVGFTKKLILLYSLLLFAVAWLPFLVGMSGVLYLVLSCALNLRFMHLAWRLYKGDNQRDAMRLFAFSIVYLMLLFVALLADHWLFALL
ncbi:protoheme IX farnesyltransferase [Agarivorans sp. OAG1]|uniref:heme o synthase n=1 Tax=unclassified Agarivorans TaxID=2636026 RepID=UPI00128B03F8|nr:heme o synthase [Agarivorans sp. B2Z047]MPW30130.1 protoheme IX farnesyltransferase [Agarivorans sp. B2Z047]UQN43237.1 heme o synthase [Agarivorans sp. B2Z047]BEU01554.1 protoheme IX farnesyltransferase [Agarivorans sp. OAG1]